jgi:hypothetical protein
MSNQHASPSKWSIRGVYFFTFVLVFWPVADLVTSTWPVQLDSLQWRYGFMGLLAGFLHTPILGVTLAMALAYALRHGTVMRILAALELVCAAGLALVLVFFALDVVQLRSTVPADRLPSFQVGALIAELKHFTSFIALVLLGLGGWRTAASLKVREEKSARQPNIVMKSDAKSE